MPGRGLALLRAPVKPLMVIVGVLSAVLVPAVAFPTLAVDPAPPPLNPPLVGFSFSPVALAIGSDPDLALAQLLHTLQPDLVRLPVYWNTVAPTATTLDYSEVDGLIKTVQAHNAQKGSRHTDVVLVVGARNLVYPEVHLPGWLDTTNIHKLETLLKTADYRRYLDTTFRRYASLPLLRAWQVENEPLDNASTDQVTSGALPASMIRAEVDLLRSIDLVHEVVVTTFNSSHVTLDLRAASPLAWLYTHLPGAKPAGHPSQALTMGDTLGLDLYVVTQATPLQTISPTTRIAWKEESLDYWQSQASKHGRALWVTELQASPWAGTTGFTVSDLLSSALAYRGHGVSAYLLWGVEDWLNSPDWMQAGLTSIRLLRSGR
jgi:hypothetical protein